MAVLNWTKYHTNQLPPMTCELVLDEDQPQTFKAGDTVRGNLVLKVTRPFFTYAIRVCLEGSSMVKLGESKTQTKTETFFNKGINVYGRDEKIGCAAGDYKFPFALKLTPSRGELPGSFRSSFGFVLYQLTAYLKQELRSFKQAEKGLTVHPYFNISKQEPSILTPVVYERVEKCTQVPVLCRPPGPKLKVTLRLPRSGFLPGEAIPFELELDNPSNHKMSGITLALLQKGTYSVGTSQKVKLVEFQRKEISEKEIPEDSKVIINSELAIPSEGLSPSQRGIIEFAYLLKVRVASNSPESPTLMDVPLKMGTRR